MKITKYLRPVIVTALLVGGTGIAVAAVQSSNDPSQPDTPQTVLPSTPATAPTDTPSDNQKSTTPDDQSSLPADNSGGAQTGDSTATSTPPTDDSTPDSIPAPVPVPVTLTGSTMRFIDVSPADAPNTVAQEWCDYTYSDGSTNTVLNSTITQKFKQPISSYNNTNRPTLYGAC